MRGRAWRFGLGKRLGIGVGLASGHSVAASRRADPRGRATAIISDRRPRIKDLTGAFAAAPNAKRPGVRSTPGRSPFANA